jgi:CRP/FNR family transcriptional regulator, cyclic AMP receptor protein
MLHIIADVGEQGIAVELLSHKHLSRWRAGEVCYNYHDHTRCEAMVDVSELHPFSFFAPLDGAALDAVAQRMQRRCYRAGEYILLEGEKPSGLFFVCRGRVRLSRTATDGREQVLATLGLGASFISEPLFDAQPNHASARAMSAVECLLLPSDDFTALIRRYPDVAVAALRDQAARLRELVELVDDLAFRSVRARLARQLLAEASSGMAQLTQQELAERAGTVREIAGRALRRMAADGLVRLERGRVIVLDRKGLVQALER